MSKHLLTPALFFITAIFATLPATAQTQLRDLQAIVIGESASKHEKKAASVLQQHLTTMIDKRLAINPEAPSPDSANIILVGRQASIASGMIAPDEFEHMHPDGFLIRIKKGRVALAGRNDWAAVYAAYTWLEQLGYHYYAPGCEIVPKLEQTILDDGTTADQPAMEFRRGINWQLRGTPRDLIGDPSIPGRELGVKMWIDHTAGLFIPRTKYFESHPQYYPLRRDGKRGLSRDSDGYVHLCLSNPEVVQLTTENALKWIRSQQDRRFFFIAQGDGHDWCQCANCLAMDQAPGVYADRMLIWVNHIARAVRKEFPDKVLLSLAYTGADEPPVREKPEDNVLVLYCPYWGINLSMAHPLTHPLNREALTQFLGWQQTASAQLGIYDYNLGFCPSWKAMAKKVQWYAHHKVRGIFLLGQPKCFHGLFAYLVGRLQWTPSLDPDALTEQFVNAYYGDAAPHITKLLTLIEAQLDKGYGRGLHDGGHMPAPFYEHPAADQMFQHLDDALAAVAGNDKITARITRERALLTEDYLTAVTLKNDTLSTMTHQHALGMFKQSLKDQLAARHALEEKINSAPEKRRAGLQKQFAKAERQMKGRLAHFAGVGPDASTSVTAVAELLITDHEQTRNDFRLPDKRGEVQVDAQRVTIPSSAFEGGLFLRNYNWFCTPPKDAVAVYAPLAPRPSAATATFKLDAAPAGEIRLEIEGQDSQNDLLPTAQIELRVNDTIVHSGDCGFVKQGWSSRNFTIPQGALRRGDNTLELRNIYGQTQRLDAWWFMLARAVIHLSDQSSTP